MRVAFVNQDLFAQGAQRVTALMVQGFIKAGYEVDLLVSKVHSDLVKSGRTDQFDVPSNTRWIHLKDRRARRNIKELRMYLKTTDADAVIAMTGNYTKALRIASIGLGRRPMIIHVEHGLASCDDQGNRRSPRWKWSPRSLLDAWFWSGVDRVFSVSKAGVKDFREVHPWYPQNRISVVYNPVIDDAFFIKRQCAPTHPWLKEKTCLTLVTAGAFVENKGHMTILRAMKRIKQTGQKVRVVIFGEGPLRDTYCRFIQENDLADFISLPGYTRNFYAEAKVADGYLLSSITESFGLALVEGLACGCPVVATDAPFGPREILADGKYGRIVPVGDDKAYANAILELSNHNRPIVGDEAWEPYRVEEIVKNYIKGMSRG